MSDDRFSEPMPKNIEQWPASKPLPPKSKTDYGLNVQRSREALSQIAEILGAGEKKDVRN